MEDLVMGAMGSLIPKLIELLRAEYNLQVHVKERISSLAQELEVAQAALREVAQVPWDQLDGQVQIWARQVREASYDMEDVLDTILVRVPDLGRSRSGQQESLLKPLTKMANLFKKSKARRKIQDDVKDIMSHLQEVTEHCRRYKVADIVARPATASTIDPRLHVMYTQVNKLVGIDKSSAELKSKLQLDDMSNTKMKTVSIVGIGGLGKTTVAKAVYENLRRDFNCRAFVYVGRNPDLNKVLQQILISLDKKRYEKFNFSVIQDFAQLIHELREFLHDNKRYFIVIDDIWEKQCWETLKLAIADDKNFEGRIIITTRKWEVAKSADEVYELPPLPYGSSRKLFYTRIYGDEMKYIDYEPDEVSDEILRKCAGIPLAIITIASLLVAKPKDRWFEIFKSIGFGYRDNEEAENITKKILSFSYYDLPSHLRTCLLYLCGFPEKFVIKKEILLWKWIAEGFINKRPGRSLFQLGERFFNDLINTSLIEAVMVKGTGLVYGCRVGSIVYDLIRSLSHEENFVCVLDDAGLISRSDKIRCLAIQNSNRERSLGDNMNLSKLRSLTATGCPMYMIPPVVSFILLRVLDLESCGSMEGYDHDHIGELLHLRFLGLRNTLTRKLPESIGRLKFLQALELGGSGLEELPGSMDKLATLMFLNADWTTRVPDCIGMLTSLEHLVMYPGCYGDDVYSARCFIQGLRNLRDLRVLRVLIKADDEEQLRDLLQSLSNLRKIEVIHFDFYGVQLKRGVQFEPAGFALSENLRFLELSWFELSRLPSWINAQHFQQLCHLSLMLSDVDEQDLEILGGFTELRHLHLLILNTESRDAIFWRKQRRDAITCASGGFQKLAFCSITKPLKFLQGAMPRLEVLDFHFNVRLQSGADRNLDFDFGLENIPSLQQVIVQINCLHAFPEEVEQAEAALRHTIGIHPNRPIPDIILSRPKLEKANNEKGKAAEMAEGHSKLSYYSKSFSSVHDGIDKPTDELIKRLFVVDSEAHNKKMKILPIVRSEGLGKNNLAQKVFDKLSPHFDRAAFVLVGQNPDMRKVFTDILIGLDKQKYNGFPLAILDIMELIGLVRKSLINKRFFVVIDDVWDFNAWDLIKCALVENSNGSAVLTTRSRRNWEHQNWWSSGDDKSDFDADKQLYPSSPTDLSLHLDAGTSSDVAAFSPSNRPSVELRHEADCPDLSLHLEAGNPVDVPVFSTSMKPHVELSHETYSPNLTLDLDAGTPTNILVSTSKTPPVELNHKPDSPNLNLHLDAGTPVDVPMFSSSKKPHVELSHEPDSPGLSLDLDAGTTVDIPMSPSKKPRVELSHEPDSPDLSLHLDAGAPTDVLVLSPGKKPLVELSHKPDSHAFGISQVGETAPEPSLFPEVDLKGFFYEILFGSEYKCPDDLKDICKDLIEMSAGILSDVYETVEMLKAVPTRLEDWQPVYQRRKFDLSYPKLPDHLKNCLSYFSMFPKGYEISAERLVWAWIAQGFVKESQGQQDWQKQEVGKSYLSDLINRKMIEAVELDADGMALSCRAYDLLHDFIISKSREEHFAAILNDSQETAFPPLNVHRLSIQIQKNNILHSWPKAWLKQVQSLVSCNAVPSIKNFQGVHAMDLGACDSLQASHLEGISKTPLTYLVIGGKYIASMPKEIARMRHLRTLDLSASGLSELPQCVLLLFDLERLFVNSHLKIPNGIAKMSSLLELGDINIVKPKLLKELCKLRKLRVLRIAMWSWDHGKSCKVWWDTLRSVVVLCKNIESLSILTSCPLDFMDGSDDNKWPPQKLKKLEIWHRAFHDKLPSWFDSLSNVSSLTVVVNKLSKNIFSTLGKLPSLCSLSLTSKDAPEVYIVIDSDTLFKKLESLKFVCSAMVPMMFAESNAWQHLKRLTIVFQASRTKVINENFRFCLDNLRSVEQVRVEINCFYASHQMVNDVEDAIRKEFSRAGSGSSQPNLEIRRLEEEGMIEEEVRSTGHHAATASSLKTEGNGDKSNLMDVLESTTKTMQAEPVVMQATTTSAVSMKIEKSTERALWQELAAEKQGSTALYNEVDELKKKSRVTEQALANTQREFEEFKRQMEKNNLLLERILQLNNASIS